MCLFTSARTVAIVFARLAGSEAIYCAGVLTFAAGFIACLRQAGFVVLPNEVYHRTFGTWWDLDWDLGADGPFSDFFHFTLTEARGNFQSIPGFSASRHRLLRLLD